MNTISLMSKPAAAYFAANERPNPAERPAPNQLPQPRPKGDSLDIVEA